MNRPFYSEYVRHALRFYTRNLKALSFNTKVDKENWMACHISFKGYSDRERDMLISVYGGYDTLADNVYETARKHDIDQSVIWDMMKEFERKIAKRRGLM